MWILRFFNYILILLALASIVEPITSDLKFISVFLGSGCSILPLYAAYLLEKKYVIKEYDAYNTGDSAPVLVFGFAFCICIGMIVDAGEWLYTVSAAIIYLNIVFSAYLHSWYHKYTTNHGPYDM